MEKTSERNWDWGGGGANWKWLTCREGSKLYLEEPPNKKKKKKKSERMKQRTCRFYLKEIGCIFNSENSKIF